jgi:hypothetical protein
MRHWLISLLTASTIATIMLPVAEYTLGSGVASAAKATRCYKNGKIKRCGAVGGHHRTQRQEHGSPNTGGPPPPSQGY